MKYSFEQHSTDEALDLYALGRLDEPKTELVEQHLLICEECRVRLDEADSYTRAMRVAAARLQLESRTTQSWKWLGEIFSFTRTGWVTAAACVAICAAVLFAGIHWMRPPVLGSVAVSLVALRGESVSAPAGRILDLKLDSRGLLLGPNPQTELVDAEGRVLEASSAFQIADGVQFHTREGLPPGAYFIRLFRSGNTEPAREFALSVK